VLRDVGDVARGVDGARVDRLNMRLYNNFHGYDSSSVRRSCSSIEQEDCVPILTAIRKAAVRQARCR